MLPYGYSLGAAALAQGSRIGRTLAVNPGSSYEDGVLQAAIVDLDSKKGEVKHYLLING